jgi:hypothetical protein
VPYDDYQIPTRLMTAEDAFAVILEMMRHVTPPEALNALSFDTAIVEWECDMIEAGDISIPDGFNGIFGTTLPAETWQAALEPARERTLGDVCRLVAGHAVVPVIEPVTVMGDHSHAAGAFLAVRRILADEGVDVSDLRPSSPIGPYLREKWPGIVARLKRLAPGRLPPTSVVAPAHVTCGIGVVASYIVMMLGLFLRRWLPLNLALAGAVCFVGFLISAFMLERWVKPADVRIGATRSFRDLCEVLVGERDAWPGFPVTAGAR